jgi:hypothetical protein
MATEPTEKHGKIKREIFVNAGFWGAAVKLFFIPRSSVGSVAGFAWSV